MLDQEDLILAKYSSILGRLRDRRVMLEERRALFQVFKEMDELGMMLSTITERVDSDADPQDLLSCEEVWSRGALGLFYLCICMCVPPLYFDLVFCFLLFFFSLFLFPRPLALV